MSADALPGHAAPASDNSAGISRRELLGQGLLAGGFLMLGGCNIVAPIVTILDGPPTREALYTLEPRPTVVFVDDRRNVIPLRSTQLRRQLGRRVTTIINSEKELNPENMIDSTDAIALADARDRSGQLVSREMIGQEVGAEVLIAIEMQSFAFLPNSVPRPAASARVSILDISARERVFPSPASPQPFEIVSAQLLETDPLALSSESGRVRISFEVIDQLAVEIGKLFYEHEIKELGGNLNPR